MTQMLRRLLMIRWAGRLRDRGLGCCCFCGHLCRSCLSGVVPESWFGGFNLFGAIFRTGLNMRVLVGSGTGVGGVFFFWGRAGSYIFELWGPRRLKPLNKININNQDNANELIVLNQFNQIIISSYSRTQIRPGSRPSIIHRDFRRSCTNVTTLPPFSLLLPK